MGFDNGISIVGYRIVTRESDPHFLYNLTRRGGNALESALPRETLRIDRGGLDADLKTRVIVAPTVWSVKSMFINARTVEGAAIAAPLL